MFGLKIRQLLALGIYGFFCVALAWSACSKSETPGKKNATSIPSKPNVIFIVVDTLRFDHLGAYGYKTNTSPFFDALARDSILFKRAYSAAPWTLPSVSAMLTGAYPSVLGIKGEFTKPNKKVPQLAQQFKQNGYKTGAVVSHFLIGKKFDFHRGFDYFDEKEGGRGHWYISSAKVTDKGTDFIEDHADKPFFLFLHYFDPHYEYVQHKILNTFPEYKGKLSNDMIVSKIRKLSSKGLLTPEDKRHLRALYDSEIRFTDHHMGRIIQTLKDEGLYDNAIIVFTADHGEELAEREDGWIGHAKKITEAMIRVPLTIKLPQNPHKVIEKNVSLIDLSPTISRAANLTGSKHPAVSGKPWDLRSFKFPKKRVFADTHRWADLETVIWGKWKMIFCARTRQYRLYDIKKDPQEQHNVIASHEQIATKLKAALSKQRKNQSSLKQTLNAKDTKADLSSSDMEKLKALGYIN